MSADEKELTIVIRRAENGPFHLSQDDAEREPTVCDRQYGSRRLASCGSCGD
jgi:hypothetical protein